MEVFKYNGKQKQTYIFLLILFSPFWVVAMNDKLSSSSYTTNDKHQKEARFWLHMCTSWNNIKIFASPLTSSHLRIKTIMIWSELIKLHTFKYTKKIWNTKKRGFGTKFSSKDLQALHTARQTHNRSVSLSDASAVLVLLQLSLQLMCVLHEFVCVDVCQPKSDM